MNRIARAAHRRQEARNAGLRKRLFTRRGAHLLARNTVVSTGAFLLGLALLWALVERLQWDELVAAGLSFFAANSLHYALGRSWVYRGTRRKLVRGFAYFLANALVGLAITIALFAVLVGLGVHYLIARVLVSIVAGLVLFVINAHFNFRSL